MSTLDEAASWTAAFLTWEATWQSFLKEQTRARPGVTRPKWVRPGQQWWHTHQLTRRAHRLLTELLADEHLFTWLHMEAEGIDIARTTNPLEGGPNKAIKDFLRHHRGLSDEHAQRGVDWLLYQWTEAPKDPWEFVTAKHWQAKPRGRARAVRAESGRAETDALYGTSFSVEHGNGIQKRRAGRRG